MKQFLLAISLLLASAGGPFEPFTFVQMSDTQIGFMDRSPSYIHSDTLMRAAVNAANALDPAYVFVTGDLVNDSGNAVQDSIYRVRISEVMAPVYAIPGNHDIQKYTPEKRDAYVAQRGYDRFAFQDRGCAFIGFDTNCIKDGAEEAEAEQWAWLEKQLADAQKCRYTFVFIHCPVIKEALDEAEDNFNFSMEQWKKYIALFKRTGVDVIFAGHTHQEYETEVEGIRFVTAGPVGNALGHGKSGYNVVRVGEDGIEVTYTPTPGITPARRRFF